MSDPEKGGFWREIAKELGIDPDKVTAEFEDVQKAMRELGQEIQQAAWDGLSEAEKKAAWVALKREELWKDYQMNDRLAGAAITGKFGLLAGPLAKLGIPLAAAYGFFKGPEIVKGHDSWLAKHRPNEEDGDQPRSPADGP